jgi:DNA repair protein RadC
LLERSNAVKPLVESGEFPTINAAIVETFYKTMGINVLKSFMEWKKEGKHVIKGSKAFPVWGKPVVNQTEQQEQSRDEIRYWPVKYLFSDQQVQEPAASSFDLCEKLAEIRISFSHPVPPADRLKIASPKDAADAFRLIYTDCMEHHERFEVMLLNRASAVLGFFKVSEGGLTSTVVDPRMIMQVAIKANATGLILCHNHPTSNTQPSEADITLTKKIKKAALLLDLHLMDHIIITRDGYYSFADEGTL